ncbi:hypothetical protein AADG42_10160 [Ammonicoccus fulvus]|uniref:Uncharacterized protein n=1 Tax=Ammonicoccus fulvus TaxID=3138240 RepID=A0ABZ3FRD2_9ACTN
MPTPVDLRAFMGVEVDSDQADAVLRMSTAFCRAYTRGNGFNEWGPNEEIFQVIVAMAARLAANPDGASSTQRTAGPFSETRTFAAFRGINLGEQAVLNRYRRRAQ